MIVARTVVGDAFLSSNKKSYALEVKNQGTGSKVLKRHDLGATVCT